MVFLELGVGDMTPSNIKFPFWEMVRNWVNVQLVSINLENASVPEHIKDRTVTIHEDIYVALVKVAQKADCLI